MLKIILTKSFFYYYCSAGIGRTGTFIVLDILTFEGENRGSVDIFGSVVSLRNQRCNMVQTPVSFFPDHITLYKVMYNTFLHSYCFSCQSINLGLKYFFQQH